MSNVPMNTVCSSEPLNHEELSYYLVLIISFPNYCFIFSSNILVKKIPGSLALLQWEE